jgi:hypothetical protein
MAQRIEIGERIKGTFRDIEDLWHLVVDDDGTRYVEHEWTRLHHHDPRPPEVGTRKIPIDEFFAGDFGHGIKEDLRQALRTIEQRPKGPKN